MQVGDPVPAFALTDLDGKTPIELAGINNEAKKDIVVKMLEAAM